MGVTDRWVRKLLKRMKKRGDAVVVHGLRDRASNRKIASQTQKRAIEVLKQADWHDFGPTFASEQLAKRHQIRVGKETLRGWMIEAGLWKPGARRIEASPQRVRRTGAVGHLRARLAGVAAMREKPGGADVWLLEIERGIANRLTYDSRNGTLPAWSANGRIITFQVGSLFRADASGSGAPEPLTKSGDYQTPPIGLAMAAIFSTLKSYPVSGFHGVETTSSPGIS
jgi:hypothetical protein